MPDARWLIWSIEHTAWWRPGEMGYTTNLHEAGRYLKPRAAAIVASANVATFEECMIPVSAIGAAPELLAALKDICESAGPQGWQVSAGFVADSRTSVIATAVVEAAHAAIAKADGA